MLESLLQSVCSGTTLLTGEMAAFYIFDKNSVTCIGTLREDSVTSIGALREDSSTCIGALREDSVTCFVTLREEALTLYNFRKISI